MTRFVPLALVVVAACATPETFDATPPRELWSRAPLPPAEELEARAYPLSGPWPAEPIESRREERRRGEAAQDLERLLVAVLPEGRWPAGASLELGRDSLAVVQTPAAHERIGRILEALEAARQARLTLSVRLFDVAHETAAALGLFETAAGEQGENPWLKVPLAAGTLGRLEEREVLIAEGECSGRAGQWLPFADLRRRGVPRGLGFRPGGGFATEVAFDETGVELEAALVPFAGDATFLVAFRARESLALEAGTLACRAFSGRTTYQVALPAVLKRRAEDAVLLGDGEALALVGAGHEPGRARVLVLVPGIQGGTFGAGASH